MRPWHGEIWIGRRDGHPSLRSKYVQDYIVSAQMRDESTAPYPQTKYLTTKVWLRHLHYTHNISGEPPPVVVKNKKKIVVVDESQKE